MHMTTNVVSSNPIKWCVTLRVLRFPPPIKLTATISLKYCWK